VRSHQQNNCMLRCTHVFTIRSACRWKLKPVAQCYITLKCCVGRCIPFVSNIKKNNREYKSTAVTDTVYNIMLIVRLHLEISTTQCVIRMAQSRLTWVIFLVEANILVFNSTQTECGAFLASYQVGTC
jgi:hypothetical protein